MRRLLIALVLVGAAAVGLGFYQGWFHVGADKGSGKSNVTLTMDTDKFKEDRKAAKESATELGNKIKDKVTGHGDTTMDGAMVSLTADKLTMTSKEGKEHSHPLAANVAITCDGKACTAVDLKAGMRIRVTSGAAAPHAAERIEALDANRDFEKGV